MTEQIEGFVTRTPDPSCLKGAAILVEQCGTLRAGEKCVVVTDYGSAEIGRILAHVAQERGAEVTLVSMAPRPAHGVAPPAAVAAAMAAADIVFMPTSKSISHTAATLDARKAGARIITLPEVTMDMLREGAIFADFRAQAPVTERVAAIFTRASRARLTSSDGRTDVAFSLAGRHGRALSGIVSRPGEFAAPPNIESSIAPVEDTAEGSMVVNSIAGMGVLETEVRVTFRNGRIVDIAGGEEADRLKAELEGARDDNVYRVAELGVGLNPAARARGFILEDEAVLGSVHVAVGSNFTFGGAIRASRHIDLIHFNATLQLDDEPVLRDGKLLV